MDTLMDRRSPRRALSVLSLATALAPLFLAAQPGCVDPPGAMKDYLKRSEAQRNEYLQAESDASVSADAGSFSGGYVLVCLSPLVAGDTQRTLRFKATVDFQATGEGAGPITMKMQPLPIGATNLSSPIGPEFSGSGGQVTAGKFQYDFGDTPDLPREANPLTGVEWGINKLSFKGTFTDVPKRFCANLTGATRPSGLDASGTVCLFFRTETPSEDVVIPAASEFTCPQ